MKHTLHSRLTAFALLVVVLIAVVSSRAGSGRALAATPRSDRLPFPACVHLHVPCATSPGPRVK